MAQPSGAIANPFDHPDAQRRFRVMTNIEELQRALDFPWEKWTVFLHPEQRQWVERDYTGPARVSGSAGTGKTIVALHRAVHLARTHPDARVLLATFSDTLAHALQTKLRRLVGNEPRLAERIDVYSLNAIGLRLYKAHCGAVKLASCDDVRELLHAASQAVGGHKFSLHFLLTEWEQVVDAWQLESWEAYRDVARLGRKTRLPEAQRAMLVVHLRAGAGWAEGTGPDNTGRRVHRSGVRTGRQQEPALRLRRRGRSAGHQCLPAALLRRIGRGPSQRPVLRRRPRPADLSATLLLEIPGRGHPRPFAHPARQLPHLPPDPPAGRPLARPGNHGCGRQQRRPQRHHICLQRTAPDHPRLRG